MPATQHMGLKASPAEAPLAQPWGSLASPTVKEAKVLIPLKGTFDFQHRIWLGPWSEKPQ